jgi:Cu-processing system permease protein
LGKEKLILEYKKLKSLFLFEFYENIRNRWLYLYFSTFFLISTLLIFSGGSESERISASLLNEVLLIIPLFTLIFGSIRFMDSLPFMEVLLSRSENRFFLFFGKWLGMGFCLNLGFLLGSGIPLLFYMSLDNIFIPLQILTFGVLLNFLFLTLSFFFAIQFSLREVSLAVSLLLWFYFYLFYDLVILALSVNLGDYPLEPVILLLIILNPIDLVRVLLLLQMDIAALMGFTSAFFQKYMGNQYGIIFTIFLLILWILIPFYFGNKRFSKKDL